jgi:hypothetical protein
MHRFFVIGVGAAIDVLRGDLEGIEQQAGAAGVEAGVEQGAGDLGERDLDGGSIFEQRDLDVARHGAAGFGRDADAGVKVAKGGVAESRGLASVAVGLDVTAK